MTFLYQNPTNHGSIVYVGHAGFTSLTVSQEVVFCILEPFRTDVLMFARGSFVVLCRWKLYVQEPTVPNDPLRHPKYRLRETMRPLIELHWGMLELAPVRSVSTAWTCKNVEPSLQGAPEDYITIRILETIISGIPLILDLGTRM